MKLRTALMLSLAVGALVACGPASDDPWFSGGLGAATEVAAERDTLVMVEFYTDWCSWCRRLESETLTDREVRCEMEQLVAMRLNAEGNGQSAAERFGVETYPTVVFLDSRGDEVERIVGYLPPEKFVGEVRRIRTGDTLFACLQELQTDPSNIEAIQRAVEGLLERSDPEGAISKIKNFHAGTDHAHEVCQRLMFLAGRDLHYRVYLKAGKLYREGWHRSFEVPPVPGSKSLSDLLEEGLTEIAPEEQAQLMRDARFDDASDLLELVTMEKVDGEDSFGVAAFAFRGGHYALAADLYERWFNDSQVGHSAESLNRAAWQLYLARQSLDTAVAMASKAYDADPSADVADTLARLRYVNGDRDRAIELARKAASLARGAEAEQYLGVARRMEAGLDLDDRPAFEEYPGPRELHL